MKQRTHRGISLTDRRINKPYPASAPPRVTTQEDHKPEDTETGYRWLMSYGDERSLMQRIEAVRRQVARTSADASKVEEAYGPFEGDRVAWYLLFARALIEAPTNLDVVQASRVLPFISALGRNAEILSGVDGVSERVKKWLSPGQSAYPDGIIFELLVAAAYRREGWKVRFIPENGRGKTPDIELERNGEKRIAECKRLEMRAESARAEGRCWRRLWEPLAASVVAGRFEFVFTITLHRPMDNYHENYLRDRLAAKLPLLASDGIVVDDEMLRVSVEQIDMERVKRELKAHYAKCGSPREIQLLTGRYDPRGNHFSAKVVGRRVPRDDAGLGPALYWDHIDYATGAFWRCDAMDSIERKARDVRKHLADAARQIRGNTPACIHVGLETCESEAVEDTRFARITDTMKNFEAPGAALDRMYCHLFGPESHPDGLWDFAETVFVQRLSDAPEPLNGRLLVVPTQNAVSGPFVHWRHRMLQRCRGERLGDLCLRSSHQRNPPSCPGRTTA